jgi:hypothetical protein
MRRSLPHSPPRCTCVHMRWRHLRARSIGVSHPTPRPCGRPPANLPMKPQAEAALVPSAQCSRSAVADEATRQREPSPPAWPLQNSPLHGTGEIAAKAIEAETGPVGRAVRECKCTSSVGAAVAPTSCTGRREYHRQKQQKHESHTCVPPALMKHKCQTGA